MPEKGKLAEQLRRGQERLRDEAPVLGVVVSHSKPLFEKDQCRDCWLEDYKSELGTYVRDRQPMTRLLDAKNKPDTDGIMAFIYFLAQVASHTKQVALTRK